LRNRAEILVEFNKGNKWWLSEKFCLFEDRPGVAKS